MQKHVKISMRQFSVLVILFTIGSSILIAPRGLAIEARQDAWIAAIAALPVSFLLIGLFALLWSRFPDLTFAEYSELIVGKWIGMLLSLFFFTYVFILQCLLLREISDFTITQIMPETPLQFISLLYMVIVIMAVRLGLETFARAGEILFPWIVMLFVLFVLFLSPDLHLEKMQPILEYGIGPVLRATFRFLGFPFLELVIFLMIVPAVNRIKETGKAFIAGVFIGGIVLVIISLLSILVLGPDVTERQQYPSYTLAKKISIGNFLERLEAVIAGIWFLTLYFKLTICFYASTLSLAQTLKLQTYRPLILPLGMLVIVCSITFIPNITYYNDFFARTWTPYSMLYGIVLPLLLWGIARVRKLKTAR